jgi:membrane protein
VRVFANYAHDSGTILASGLAYQALFAVFAALWVAFSIAGLVVSADSGLQSSIIAVLDETVPGLIDGGDHTGAIDPAVLTSGAAFGISGFIALAGLLFTALGWVGAARDSVRALFDLPPAQLRLSANALRGVLDGSGARGRGGGRPRRWSRVT